MHAACMQAAYARMQPAYARNAGCIRRYAACIQYLIHITNSGSLRGGQTCQNRRWPKLHLPPLGGEKKIVLIFNGGECLGWSLNQGHVSGHVPPPWTRAPRTLAPWFSDDPGQSPPPLKSSRKDSQVFNVFRGALAPDHSEVKNVLIFNGGGGWGGGDFPDGHWTRGKCPDMCPPTAATFQSP